MAFWWGGVENYWSVTIGAISKVLCRGRDDSSLTQEMRGHQLKTIEWKKTVSEGEEVSPKLQDTNGADQAS